MVCCERPMAASCVSGGSRWTAASSAGALCGSERDDCCAVERRGGSEAGRRGEGAGFRVRDSNDGKRNIQHPVPVSSRGMREPPLR